MSANVPSPLADATKASVSCSGSGHRRERAFFSTELGTPSLTPGPGNEVPAMPAGTRPGPWLVSPPPPAGAENSTHSGFMSSPRGWFHHKLRRDSVGSKLLAATVGVLLLILSLGAYVVLTYLAVTTKKVKYIVFVAILALVGVLLVSGLRTAQQNENFRYLTEDEENRRVAQAYA